MSPERALNSIAAVVLAAGTSTRMGHNKLLVSLGGETLLRRAVRTAIAAGLQPVLVVLGHESERAHAELVGLPCTSVFNQAYAQGINTSLRTGIAALPKEATAALVMLGDMPFVTSQMLQAVVARYRESAAPLVVSSYEGVNAPPMLYDRSLFAELEGSPDGDGFGKRIVQRHRAQALEVAWPARALRDVDVPADVDAVLAELDRR
jgi:molybdenum cofactor cytidylyltransferase